MLIDTSLERPSRLGRFGLPTDRPLRWILAAGVLLRFVLFKPLYPVNNDDHFAVIRTCADGQRTVMARRPSQACEPSTSLHLERYDAALASSVQ